MKRVVSICLLFVFSLFLFCGCTIANSANLKTVGDYYRSIASENTEMFYLGNVYIGGEHINITYTSPNLIDAINQSNVASYSGADLIKYKRFALLSSNGMYSTLLKAQWSLFYSKVDLFDEEIINSAIPQNLKTDLYNNLSEIKNAIKEVKNAKNFLENISLGSTFDSISANTQNKLTLYFETLNNFIIKCQIFNETFKKCMLKVVDEPKLSELPNSISTGIIKNAIDRSLINLTSYFIDKSLIVEENLENLNENEEQYYNNLKIFLNNYNNSLSSANVNKYENFNGGNSTSSVSLTYTELRKKEQILIDEPFAKNIINYYEKDSIQVENASQTFFSNCQSYYNYANSLLTLVLNS